MAFGNAFSMAIPILLFLAPISLLFTIIANEVISENYIVALIMAGVFSFFQPLIVGVLFIEQKGRNN